MQTLAGLTIIFSAIGSVLILFAIDFVWRWLDEQPEHKLLAEQLTSSEQEKKAVNEQANKKPELAA